MDAQRRERASLVFLAKAAAQRGETLKSLGERLGIGYSTLKAALRGRGYRHPTGVELLDRRLQHESGQGLLETLRASIDAGLSRGAIARDLDVDPLTLQGVADKQGLTFPKTVILRDASKIVAAMKARIPLRNDLRVLTWKGESRCLTEWANVVGLSPSAIRKRLASGWTVDAALGTARRGRQPVLRHRAGRPADDHPWRVAEAMGREVCRERAGTGCGAVPLDPVP